MTTNTDNRVYKYDILFCDAISIDLVFDSSSM